MVEDFLECPKCGAKIPLTKSLTAPIEARLRATLEAEVTKKVEELSKKEETLKLREGKLSKTIEAEVKSRLPKLTLNLRHELSEEYESKLKELGEGTARATARAEKAERNERELRAERSKLEEREKALDLEVARQVDEHSVAIREKVRAELTEATRLKDQERALQIEGLTKQVEDLQQKLTQGSEQRQGEALEVEIEEELRRAFPADVIEPVPSGTRGADIIQKVVTPSGQSCGSIVWETKRTKDWNDAWIPKLKEDTNRIGGEASILVSRVLPEGTRNFGFSRGIVVCDFGSAIPVATLVRLRLIEVARQRKVDETSVETREQLYQYLTSHDFVSRVENIILPLIAMKSDLDSEIRAIEGRWRKRRREIEKAERSIVGIYGDLQGIVGQAKLPEVSRLALPGVSTTENADDPGPPSEG
jgi:hypothetical protein